MIATDYVLVPKYWSRHKRHMSARRQDMRPTHNRRQASERPCLDHRWRRPGGISGTMAVLGARRASRLEPQRSKRLVSGAAEHRDALPGSSGGSTGRAIGAEQPASPLARSTRTPVASSRARDRPDMGFDLAADGGTCKNEGRSRQERMVHWRFGCHAVAWRQCPNQHLMLMGRRRLLDPRDRVASIKANPA